MTGKIYGALIKHEKRHPIEKYQRAQINKLEKKINGLQT